MRAIPSCDILCVKDNFMVLVINETEISFFFVKKPLNKQLIEKARASKVEFKKKKFKKENWYTELELIMGCIKMKNKKKN